MPKDIENMTGEEIIMYLRQRDAKASMAYASQNIEDNLSKHQVPISCPNCGSAHKVKNGKRKSGAIEYKCNNCNKRFTAITNTIFENTDFLWNEMVNAVYGVITKQSLEYIAYNTSASPLSLGNAWLLQMKILCILASIPKPCLEGVIQVDEKYFRENQKGSHDLKSFLDPSEQRWARRHNYRSECGIFGPEFINVLCAVDEHRNHYAKCVSLGPLYDGALDDLEQHMKNVSYLCTDSLQIYKEWSEKKGWLHYVEPSGYRKERKSRGYVDTDNVYRKLTDKEYHKNKKINMALYKDKKYPHIENPEAEIDYDQFVTLRYKFNLNINAVNSFHSQLEKDIVKNKTGVSSNYLPLYIEAYTFLANYKAKHSISTFKKEDAEQILLEMCRNTLENKFVPTKRYIESLTASSLHRPTKKESKKAREQMKKARIVVDFERTDKKDQSAYEGDDEISQFMFNKRKFFNSLGTIRLNEIIKDNNLYVKGAHKRDKIDALCALPNADDIIFHEIYLIKYGSADEFAKTMEDITKKRHRKKKSS